MFLTRDERCRDALWRAFVGNGIRVALHGVSLNCERHDEQKQRRRRGRGRVVPSALLGESNTLIFAMCIFIRSATKKDIREKRWRSYNIEDSICSSRIKRNVLHDFHISYPNFFVPRRFVSHVFLTLTSALTPAPNHNTST